MSKKLFVVGKKIGMTQIFDSDGNVVPVTILKVDDGVVTQIKTLKSDGYNAVKIGFQKVKDGKLNKPDAGVFKKNKLDLYKIQKEFRVDDVSGYKVGDVVSISEVEPGKVVDVVGKTIGKGFQGVVKRWGFQGGPKSRGQKDKWRSPGSIGNASYPGRVWKGMKMAGRMGGKVETKQGLTIVNKDDEKKIIYIKGSIPGSKGSIVIVKESVKIKG